MFDLEDELKKLPAKPGVYIMHDNTDTIIYVGKAVSLKNRFRTSLILSILLQIPNWKRWFWSAT